MSNLDRILNLAGFEEGAQSPQEARELKAEQAEEIAQEAVGDYADPIYDLCDDLGCDTDHPVLGDLIKYLDGDTIKDFVADFRRHNDMNHPGEDGDYGDDDENFGEAEEKEMSPEDREKAIKRAFAQDEPERGSEKKKVSLKKAPWEESVSEETDGCADCEYMRSETDGEVTTCDECAAEKSQTMSEDDIDENAFNQAAAAASRAGKDSFEFGGKTHKTTMKKDTAHKLDDDIQMNEACGDCGCDPKNPTPGCDCPTHTHEEISEAPTMDSTQMVIMMKNAGLSEEAIAEKLNEWANTPDNASEVEPREHGEAYDFAQGVNLSLKRYLDAEDMKVQVTEHKVEDMKALYQSKKNK